MQQLLTLRDLEARTGLSHFTWRGYIHKGLLAAGVLGNRLVVTQEELERFLRERTRPRTRVPSTASLPTPPTVPA